MFRLSDDPTFTVEVEVRTPSDGGRRKESLTVTYRVVPLDRAACHDFTTEAGERAFLEDAVAEIGGVVDDKDKPVPWSHELRDRLFGLPYVRTALYKAYGEHVQGAAEGN